MNKSSKAQIVKILKAFMECPEYGPQVKSKRWTTERNFLGRRNPRRVRNLEILFFPETRLIYWRQASSGDSIRYRPCWLSDTGLNIAFFCLFTQIFLGFCRSSQCPAAIMSKHVQSTTENVHPSSIFCNICKKENPEKFPLSVRFIWPSISSFLSLLFFSTFASF